VTTRREQLKSKACGRIQAESARLVDLCERLHAHPELAFQEEHASSWLAEYLERIGFAVERGAFGLATAFVASRGEGSPHVTVLCEYDALPGLGHACGHNIIAAAGVGAGAGLAAVIDETGGKVTILGTPAEEMGGGKILMAEQGAFAGVDVAMMVHPAGMDLVAMNVLAVSAVAVEYRGAAAHAAAAPHRGINALDGLVTAYGAIAQLRQHIRPSERVHGIITDGGQAPNVVPERAAGFFYIRAADDRSLAELKERVTACFRAGALASGATVEIRDTGVDYAELWTNRPLASAYEENLARLGRRLPSGGQGGGVTGSTDMGNVSKIVPAIHPMIAVSPPEVALHTKEFAHWAASEAAHRAVLDGARALAMTGIDVLTDTDLLRAVKASFAADAGEPPYPSSGSGRNRTQTITAPSAPEESGRRS
jgi:amidohydrolase